jgi:YgiT-type zinc finger domain-containing protein
MKCAFCKTGETKPGETTVVLNRKTASVIIKNVPADICDTCGEYYLSDAITERVLSRAEEAIAKGVEVEILRFAA